MERKGRLGSQGERGFGPSRPSRTEVQRWVICLPFLSHVARRALSQERARSGWDDAHPPSATSLALQKSCILFLDTDVRNVWLSQKQPWKRSSWPMADKAVIPQPYSRLS